ncbi:MAG: glutamate--tRNA ligase [Thermoplasmata archaeon]|nr:glutamate--tRNA ligase [Thermoplasmata archaeon]
MQEIERIAKKYALQNAVQHNGKSNAKAVVGKIIAEKKEYREKAKEIYITATKVIQEVNRLTLEEQTHLLEKLAPELLVKEKKERSFELPPLPNAEEGKVVTRFPPEPNGYLHIGHAKAAIIDYEYARMYNGIFILRFDDTNPENASKEYYDAQKEDLRWLGIRWDKEYCTSSNLPKHYQLAEDLIKKGYAYVCVCSQESIRKNRFEGKACKCREKTVDENLSLWEKMHSEMGTGEAILRLKGDLSSSNTAMRDPTLFRIIDVEHPIQGNKYRVWSTYDFAGAVEDSISGVTHPFRTKEYELRDEVYFYLLQLLNLRKPHLMEFSRLSIEGMPVSKRKIKPLIEKGLVKGYDDFRLPTLRGLKRRGIVPEAIKQFVLSQGISKVESVVTFDQVEAINRKIIDEKAKRFFFVPNPVKLTVEGATGEKKRLKLHPNVDLGSREIETGDVFFIPKDDVDHLRVGEVFRLKDLYNVEILEKNKTVKGRFAGKTLMKNTSKIQWVTEESFPMTVYIPRPLFIGDKYNPESLKKVEGYAENAVKNLKEGEIVQFERFGFVRIEKDNGLVGIFAHK